LTAAVSGVHLFVSVVGGPRIAVANSSVDVNGHLWHVIGALGFMVIAIAGVGVSELIQRGRRHRVALIDTGMLKLPDGPPTEHHQVILAAAESGQRPASVRIGRQPRATLLPLVGLASAAAASVHLVVMPEHFREAVLYGAFFALAAALQLGFAMLTVARPSRPLFVVGLLGNLSVVILWLITRIVAIPLGPAAGTTEALGGLDILATSFEVAIVAGSIALLSRPSARPAVRPSTWSRTVWAVVAIAPVAIVATTWIAPPS
jgi:hypothetical protein